MKCDDIEVQTRLWIGTALIAVSVLLTVLVAVDRVAPALLLLAVATMVGGVAVIVYGAREL